MADGMAGHLDHAADRHADPHGIAFADLLCQGGQAVPIRGRPDHPRTRCRCQRLDPVDMVTVVVRDQDMTGVPVAGMQRVYDRCGFGDVDHRSCARRRVMCKVGVVVRQAGNGDDFQRHGVSYDFAYVGRTEFGPTAGSSAMHLDVLDLRNFYYRTQLGRAAQKAIRDQVVALWPEATGRTVAGFGFAVPLLRPYLAEARRVIGLMPGQQGVMPWPVGMENVSVLCEETRWPLDTGIVDRLVVLHGLETSENPTAVLEECWRVLGPGGRALFIVPNRSGLWSRSDRTPFGYGRPYSMGQLDAQLRTHNFVAERHQTALYVPPSSRRFWLRTAVMWERLGHRVSPVMSGGVLMLEVSKQLHTPQRPGLRAAVRKPLRVLEGIQKPVPGPA